MFTIRRRSNSPPWALLPSSLPRPGDPSALSTGRGGGRLRKDMPQACAWSTECGLLPAPPSRSGLLDSGSWA